MSNTSFGRDISCTTSLRHGGFASGARLVAQACYRRLTTPRGMLRGGEEEQSYGIDISELVGSSTSAAAVASLQGRVRAELEKDERIESVTVSVVPTTRGPATTYTITVAAFTSEGPFTLSLAASDVTVELLGIQAEG